MFAHRSDRPANFRNPPNLRTIASLLAIINSQTQAGGRTQNNKPRFSMLNPLNRPISICFPEPQQLTQLSWAPIARKRLHCEWVSDSARATDSRRRPRDRAEKLFNVLWVREDRPALRTRFAHVHMYPSICVYMKRAKLAYPTRSM